MNNWFQISKFQKTQFLLHLYPKKNNITQNTTNNTTAKSLKKQQGNSVWNINLSN